MSGLHWRSLRSVVKQHFGFLYARQYQPVRAERVGIFSSSGCIVFHRDGIWVMASRHMDEEFIELSFEESADPLDWFDVMDVVCALGTAMRAAGSSIAHSFSVKAPILQEFLPLLEQALQADRNSFLRQLVEARRRAVEENSLDLGKPEIRHSRSYGS